MEGEDDECEDVAEDDDLAGEEGSGQEGGGKGNYKPQTKAALGELRQKHENTMRLVAHLYHDRTLQDEFRIVAAASRSYMREFSETLHRIKQSQDRLEKKRLSISLRTFSFEIND